MIVEVTIVPVGTGSPGVSPYVGAALRVLRRSGLKHRLGPMGTTIEGEWDPVFATIRRMHEACIKLGAVRLLTTIRVDDRRDKPATMQGKVRSATRKAQPD